MRRLKWLAEAYEIAYNKREADSQSLTPLGARFLEKAFQHTVRLARIPDDVRERYWKRLLTSEGHEGPSPAAMLEAEQIFEPLSAGGEILDALRDAEDENRIDRYALRLAAARALEAKAVEADRHSMLDHFSVLLEGNPRTMKKLVNAYGIELETRLPDLPGDEQTLRQLALWTILSLRWPTFADYLASHPDEVEAVCERAGNGSTDDLTDELKAYLGQAGVTDVLDGKSVEPPVRLDAAAVRLFVGAARPGTTTDADDEHR